MCYRILSLTSATLRQQFLYNLHQSEQAYYDPSAYHFQVDHLLEMVEDRHGRKSTIIASQLLTNIWYEIIAEPTIADAILDRIVSNAHRIELTGESNKLSTDIDNYRFLKRLQKLFCIIQMRPLLYSRHFIKRSDQHS